MSEVIELTGVVADRTIALTGNNSGASAQEVALTGTVAQRGPTGPQGPAGANGTDGADGSPGLGLPSGGTTSQILLKTSNSDYATGWSDFPPALITHTFVVASQAAMLALSANQGDVAIRTDTNSNFILRGTSATNLSDWQELLGGVGNVNSVNGQTGNVTLTESDIGLGNVDNTSDANKPVSSATQTALDAKQGLNSDLTAIGSLSPANDDVLQRKAGAWTNRTIAQLKADLVLNNVSNVAQQPLDSTLTALAAYNANGMIVQTAADTFVGRTLIAGSSKISVSNGSGIAGNPTIDVVEANIDPANLSTNPLARANHTGTQTASTISDFNTQVRSSRLDQMTAPSSSVSMNSQRITSLADPIGDQDSATKAYVDSIATGLDAKQSCRAATTTALPAHGRVGNVLTASGNGVLADQDGITLVNGDRLLVKDEGSGTSLQNGIYDVTDIGDGSNPWVLTRSADADSSPEVDSGMYTFITEGTINANTGWVLTTSSAITLNTTALTFGQFSSAANLLAGGGLVKTGSTFDVVGTSNRIVVNADSIDIDAAYAGQSSINTLGTIIAGVWTGTTIAVANGGTGSTTASGARTNLGLGSVATQDASAINITGGSITGITDLAIADGGTAASSAASAFANLKQNATTGATGVIQLAGDLGGTAASPAVKNRVASITIAPSGTTADYNTSGSADQTVINTAIAALSAGGRIVLRAGTYTITNTITANINNITIEGEGDATVIINDASANGNLMNILADNVTVRSLKLDGNRSAMTTDHHGIAIGGSSGSPTATTGTSLINLTITNVIHHAIQSPSATNVIVDGCRISNTGKTSSPSNADGVGIIAGPDAINFKIVNTSIDNAGFNGIQVYHGSRHVIIDNVHVTNSGQTRPSGHGIYLHYNVLDVQISNAFLSYGYANGILAETTTGENQTKGVQVVNTTIEYFNNDGVGLSGIADVTIQGNNIRNNGQGSGIHYGIALKDGVGGYTTSDIRIANNNIYDNQVTATQDYPISVSGASTNVTIIGGDYYGHATSNSPTIDSRATGAVRQVASFDAGGGDYKVGRAASGAGSNTTIQANDAQALGTNLNGGNLVLVSGQSSGSGSSSIQFKVYPATSNDLTALSAVAISTINSIAPNNTNRGSGYAVSDVVTISGGGGSGGQITVATIAAAGQIASAAINTRGSGYVLGDVLTITGGGGSSGTLTVTAVNSIGMIYGASVTTGGSGYTAATGAAVSGGTGTAATFDLTLYATGAVLTLSLTAAGTGYSYTTGAATTGGTGTGLVLDITPYANVANSVSTKMTISSTNVDITNNQTTSGYLRVGSASAPNNTTAGDITGVRLSIGNTAFSASNGEIANMLGTLTDTSGTARGLYVNPTFTPGSNSTAAFIAMQYDGVWNPATGVTQSSITGINGQTRVRGDGLLATSTGVQATGMVVDSSSASAVQATTVQGFSATIHSRPSGSSTAAITTGVGYDTNLLGSATAGATVTTLTGFRMQNPNTGNTVTSLLGVDVAALTRGGTNNIGLRVAAPSGASNNYAVQLSDTGGTAAGGITFGTDTTLYRSAASTLKTDGGLLIATPGTAANSAATIDGTQTLTNKRITKRTETLVDAATVTPDSDNYDGGNLTEISQTTTIANPTGTPTSRQQYVLRIKSTTQRSITWGNQFRGSTDIALPSANTGGSKTDYLGFSWNATDSKWDLLALVQGF